MLAWRRWLSATLLLLWEEDNSDSVAGGQCAFPFCRKNLIQWLVGRNCRQCLRFQRLSITQSHSSVPGLEFLSTPLPRILDASRPHDINRSQPQQATSLQASKRFSVRFLHINHIALSSHHAAAAPFTSVDCPIFSVSPSRHRLLVCFVPTSYTINPSVLFEAHR